MKEWDLHFSPRWLLQFFLVNRVEHQKLNQTTAELPFCWVFGVQLGLRQTQALINTNCITYNPAACWIIVKSLVVIISACVCRRPSWTPKTQPNGSSAVVWLSFWCSTRFTRKKCLSQRRETCKLLSYFLYYIVYGQPLKRLYQAWSWSARRGYGFIVN